MKTIIVESNLTSFHHYVQIGDEILVMRPEAVTHGVYQGITRNRFNIEEQRINLSAAATFPAIFKTRVPAQVLAFVETLDVPRSDLTVQLGVRDFLVAKRG